VATTAVGSVLVILGIGGIAGNLPSMDPSAYENVDSVEWEWWAYFGGFAALLIVGLIVQFCYTAKEGGPRNRKNYD